MRWSVSESFNIGPLKVTVSKSGLSFSLGTKGARVSANTNGEVGVRVGAKGASYNKRKKLLPSLKDLMDSGE